MHKSGNGFITEREIPQTSPRTNEKEISVGEQILKIIKDKKTNRMIIKNPPEYIFLMSSISF